ncbi:hypothetical protein [Streptomyces sp. NPDC058664]|uniref:hypothetical protein n=1 Tax=unclassified Streptomyces TaxID=2593676 RepID=UPI00365E57E5
MAAPRTGWVASWQRRRVFRPAPYGRGRRMIAAAFASRAGGRFAGDRALRAGLGVASVLGLLGGFVPLILSQRPRQDH